MSVALTLLSEPIFLSMFLLPWLLLVFPCILKNYFKKHLSLSDRTPEAAEHWFAADLSSNSSSVADSMTPAGNFHFPIHEMIKIMPSFQVIVRIISFSFHSFS